MSKSFFNFFRASKTSLDGANSAQALTLEETAQVAGGDYNRAGSFQGQKLLPGFQNPTVGSNDGINVKTSGASTSNVGYDSPFTPIPS